MKLSHCDKCSIFFMCLYSGGLCEPSSPRALRAAAGHNACGRCRSYAEYEGPLVTCEGHSTEHVESQINTVHQNDSTLSINGLLVWTYLKLEPTLIWSKNGGKPDALPLPVEKGCVPFKTSSNVMCGNGWADWRLINDHKHWMLHSLHMIIIFNSRREKLDLHCFSTMSGNPSVLTKDRSLSPSAERIVFYFHGKSTSCFNPLFSNTAKYISICGQSVPFFGIFFCNWEEL